VQIGDDPIGKLSKVHFDPNSSRTLYAVDIERPDVKLYANGKAVAAAGFIGGARIVITSRGSDDEPLADGKNPIELAPGGFAMAVAAVNKELDADNKQGLLYKLKGITESIDVVADQLKSEMDPNQAGTLLADIHKSAADIAAIAGSLRYELTRGDDAEAEIKNGPLLVKVHASADDVNKVTGNLEQMVTTNRPKIDATLTAVKDTAETIHRYAKTDIGQMLATFRKTSDDVLKVAVNMREITDDVRGIVNVNREQIDEMIDNMTMVSAELKATAKEVRRNPWRLLYRPDDKELRSKNIYDAARAFSSGAEQLDQAVMKLNALREAHPEGLSADDPELQKVRKQVEESFAHFSKVEQALWEELTK